jgi:hypothetical protein
MEQGDREGGRSGRPGRSPSPAPGNVTNTKADGNCNAISIGLAFDADEIALPSKISPPTDAGKGLPPCGASGSGSGG